MGSPHLQNCAAAFESWGLGPQRARFWFTEGRATFAGILLAQLQQKIVPVLIPISHFLEVFASTRNMLTISLPVARADMLWEDPGPCVLLIVTRKLYSCGM